MAFLDLIPLVGATLGGVDRSAGHAVQRLPDATIVWVVFFIIYQQVENNVLQPVVYRRTVNVAPLAVIVAILIGGSLLGILGALVAIPVAAAIQIVVRELWSDAQGAAGDAGAATPGRRREQAEPATARSSDAGASADAEQPRADVGADHRPDLGDHHRLAAEDLAAGLDEALGLPGAWMCWTIQASAPSAC